MLQYLNSSGASPGHCCAGGGCDSSAREQKRVEELTWSHSRPYGQINPEDELGSNQGGKHTANPLVPLCHGVYPMYEIAKSNQRASVPIQREWPARPQSNDYLGENINDSPMKVPHPFGGLAAVGL